MKNQFMNWLVAWAYLANALLVIFSFGFYKDTSITWKASVWYLENADNE